MKPIIGIIGRPYIRNNDMRVCGLSESLKNYCIYGESIPELILPPQNIIYNDTLGSDIPPLTDEEKNDLIRMINRCDGIILQGGNRCFEYDHFIAAYIISHDIPCLGICMGMQILVNTDNNTYYGGSNEKNTTTIDHDQKSNLYVHNVSLVDNTYLSRIIGTKNFKVNSMHSYHVSHVTNFIVNALSEDGLIEGVEYPGKKFIVGVQWHPEKTFNNDIESRKLISEFIKVCKD